MHIQSILRSLAFTGLAGLAFASGVANVEKVASAKAPVPAVKPATILATVAAVTTAVVPPVQNTADAGWDLPNLEHERVDYWVDRFTTDKRDDFAVFLQRMTRYAPMISEKLTERGMPQDLVYLAMIESGFNPHATSSAKAKGLWQFIEPTAERYGLVVNKKIDERTHPEKSTEAALSYLSDLHDRFDSWYLAAAAYNTGENRVGRIMREATGSERGSETDYYAIAHRLPSETADYVPLMIAAARIAKDPARYGFEIEGGLTS